MAKMSDEELALKASKHIVEFWESIPKRVDDFCEKFGEQYREAHEEMLRSGGNDMLGGEKMYKASKAFLASRGHVLIKIVDIPGPSRVLVCSHGIRRGDYCSECKGVIGENEPRMAITDPTPENTKKLVELRTKSKELLKKHEHYLPIRQNTMGEDYVTNYYCPECGHPKPGHHDACVWGMLVKDW